MQGRGGEVVMVGQQLGDKIVYAGMERDLRILAVNDKLAPVEKIACMTRWEVCDLVAKKYEMVFAESEKVGLVKIEDMDTYKKIVCVLAR